VNKTSIEWTDYTSNLIRYRDPEGRSVHGCIKVSAGCANCYASAWSARGPLLGQLMLRRPFVRDHKNRNVMTEDDDQRPIVPGAFPGLHWVIVGGESGPGGVLQIARNFRESLFKSV